MSIREQYKLAYRLARHYHYHKRLWHTYSELCEDNGIDAHIELAAMRHRLAYEAYPFDWLIGNNFRWHLAQKRYIDSIKGVNHD